MTQTTFDDFLTKIVPALPAGPVALVFVEDEVEVLSTLDHHRALGFAQVIAFVPPQLADALALPDDVTPVVLDTHARDAVPIALTRIADRAPGACWLYWCYNAEYLLFPFCETRRVGEMLAFHAEERRAAMMATVVDLYAADLRANPSGACLADAMFDRTGYYSRPRFRDGQPLDRQIEIFGGLRWRFEEHIPWARRRLDRVALFRPKQGLKMQPDFTLSEDEMNTINCPWHRNLTVAVASFRVAKALKSNPGPSAVIDSFRWSGSEPFRRTSMQMMELGLMEPGQWF